MEIIIETVGEVSDETWQSHGTYKTNMEHPPRIGETLRYRNDINDQDIFVRVSEIHREVHVKKDGQIKESAIITGILDPES